MKRFLKKLIKKLLLLRFVMTDLPWVTVGNHLSPEKAIQKIAPVVYQTWESHDFGRRHARELKHFRELNPGLDFFIFNKYQRDTYMKENWGNRPIYTAYQDAIFGQTKADIFRYCIIYDRGGYYFDISKGCRVPLFTLHSANSEGLITNESNSRELNRENKLSDHINLPEKYFAQWAFGFTKGHKLLEMVIKGIEEKMDEYYGRKFKSPSDAILDFTATHHFTDVVHLYAQSNDLSNITQAGIDFNGYGVFSLEGSEVRYLQVPEYKLARNKPLMRG
jgi:mannosyltransferase OCH1-like enzyme